MKRSVTIILTVLGLISCSYTGGNQESTEIKIQWVDNLTGDFSFKDKWSYPEGVFRNEFGQLSCDGLCPPEIDNMKDENGKIFADSLDAFYNLVDTTHFFHSINSEAQIYEWGGADFVTVERFNEDTVICFSQNNAATHSSLNLTIVGNMVKPTIVLTSVSALNNTKTYNCSNGTMIIDKNLWKNEILKASFDFEFKDDENPSVAMWWRGKIYAKIGT